MRRALRIEWWKFRRSRVVQVATTLMAVLLPVLGLGMYSVARSDLASPIAGKVTGLLIGDGWEAYLGVISQIAAAAVFVGAGVVATWVFGREHTDQTFPSLFAMSVPRSSIAVAKFVVLIGWVGALTVLIVIFAVAVGAAGSVEAGTSTLLAASLRLTFVIATTGFLSLTAGYAASVGRGYLPAIGAIIVVVAIAQISVLFGVGGWFPFAVPGLIAITGSEVAPDVSAVQVSLVPVVVIVTIWITARWWQRAQVV